jgi:uncharacterized protein (TIGR02118 family)
MIKVTVMYPNQEGTHFDIDYYCTKHMPLARRLVGPALLNVSVDEGFAGSTPDSPAPYFAIGHLYFDSMASFMDSFPAHVPQLLADVPNFTNAHPTIQISNVKL